MCIRRRNPPTRLSLQSGAGAGGGRKTASPPNVPRLYGVPQPAPPGAMSQAAHGGLLALQQQLHMQHTAGGSGIGRPLSGGGGEGSRWPGAANGEAEKVRGYITVNPEGAGQSSRSWRTARAEEQRRVRNSARSWAQVVLSDVAPTAAMSRSGAQSERLLARSPSYSYITMPDASFANALIRNHTALTFGSYGYDPSAYACFEHDYIIGQHAACGFGHVSSGFGVVSSCNSTSNNSSNACALPSSPSPTLTATARSLLYATTGPGGAAATSYGPRSSKPGGVSASMATRGGRYGPGGNPGPLGPVIGTGTALGNRREVASATHVPLPMSTVSVVSTSGFGAGGAENEPDFAGPGPAASGPTAYHAAPLGGGFAGASSNYKLRMVNHPVTSPTASGTLLGSGLGGASNSPAHAPAPANELDRPASRHTGRPSPSRGN